MSFPTIEEFVGNTPLVRLQRLINNSSNTVLVKLEGNNPAGSVKDRPALSMIKHAEQRGEIKQGDRLIEATSGNTGVALSYFAREMGYDITIVMPSNMTDERKTIIKGFGANLVLCDAGDFAQAVEIRDELAAKPGYFNPDQ